MSAYVSGIHAVLEALRAATIPEKVIVREGPSGRLSEVVALARKRRVPVVYAAPHDLHRRFPDARQDVVALVSAHVELEIDDLEPRAGALWVAIDGITDPMNLGAVLRSAEAAGAAGILLPRRRTAPLTPVVVRASAGALAHLPVAKVSSLPDALLRARERGFTVVGLDASGSPITRALEGRASEPIVLVLGEEGSGLHRLSRERCDLLVGIPMRGRIASLNVSVAAGIALYEIRRQQEIPCPAAS